MCNYRVYNNKKQEHCFKNKIPANPFSGLAGRVLDIKGLGRKINTIFRK